MALEGYPVSAAAGEYLICLVKKNEMLYSERDLYIFTKNRGVESSSANAGRERMMYRLLKKWSSYGKRKNNL